MTYQNHFPLYVRVAFLKLPEKIIVVAEFAQNSDFPELCKKQRPPSA